MSEWEQDISQFKETEEQTNARLRSVYREMFKMWSNFKLKRKQQFEQACNRKADEEGNRQVKIDQMK